MKKSESIKKIYNNKIKEFNKHNELYYSKDKPLILDNEYDQLKKSILDLEKKYSFLKEAKLVNNQIVKWPEGSYHPEHYDRRKNEIDKWAFFLYLNDDFKGGELVVEGKEIIPEIGKLVIFEAGKIKHKVNKVLKGNRYTLAGWYI